MTRESRHAHSNGPLVSSRTGSATKSTITLAWSDGEDRTLVPSRSALTGTFPYRAPLHVAAGTVDVDDVACGCDYGCISCDETKEWKR